jgi:hypothetical protein
VGNLVVELDPKGIPAPFNMKWIVTPIRVPLISSFFFSFMKEFHQSAAMDAE